MKWGRRGSEVVTVKVADTTDGLDGFGTATAEYAEAEKAARALGWPVRAVCEAAVAQYRAQATLPRLHRRRYLAKNKSDKFVSLGG